MHACITYIVDCTSFIAIPLQSHALIFPKINVHAIVFQIPTLRFVFYVHVFIFPLPLFPFPLLPYPLPGSTFIAHPPDVHHITDSVVLHLFHKLLFTFSTQGSFAVGCCTIIQSFTHMPSFLIVPGIDTLASWFFHVLCSIG